MADNASVMFRTQYVDRVQAIYQQRGGKLRGMLATPTSFNGSNEAKFFVAGKNTAYETTAAGQTNTPSGQPITPLTVALRTFTVYDHVYEWDEDRLSVDEKEVIYNAGAMAMGRKADILEAIDAIKTTTNAGRAGAPKLFFPRGKYLATQIAIDEANVFLIGDQAEISTSDSSDGWLIGHDDYLDVSGLSDGYYFFGARGIVFRSSHADATVIQNKGYRTLDLGRVVLTGGSNGLVTEGAFAGASLEHVTCQSQTGIGLHIKQRNNMLQASFGACLSGHAIGVKVETDDAELDTLLFDNWDVEGAVDGFVFVGNDIGAVQLNLCRGESNTGDDIRVENADSTNKFGISINGGSYSSDVVFGGTGNGAITGSSIQNAKMANANIEVNVTSGVTVGRNSYTGTAALVFGSAQTLPAAGNPASAELMPRFRSGHGVPDNSSNTNGEQGELRYDGTFGYIKTGSTAWRHFQIAKFGATTVPSLPTGATPSVAGLRVCATANGSATSITSLPDGHAGQELLIIGADGGNTEIANTAAKLPGNTSVTLGNNDLLHLVCYQDVAPIWVCVAKTDNPA